MVRHNKIGQAFIEYTVLISIVALAISVMLPMLRRGSQSLLKAGADQIADQEGGEQDFESSGYMRGQETSMNMSLYKNMTVMNGVLSEQESENSIVQTHTEYQLSGDE